MKVRLFYTKDTPADRHIKHLEGELKERRLEVELIDADSREGAGQAEAYDIVERPSVLVTDDEGSVLKLWKGELPSADDISYYLTS